MEECQICGRKFKKITNTHVKKHDILMDEYIWKFSQFTRGSRIVPCARCGKKVRRRASTLSRLKNIFCSYRCRDEFCSKKPDREVLNEMYWKEKKSLLKIANAFDVNPSRVLKWMKGDGIPRRTGTEAQIKRKIEWDNLKKELMHQHWVEKKSARKIAQEKGVRLSTIQTWMKKLDIPSRTHSDVTKHLWQDKEYREKVIKNTLKGMFKRPTSLERRFMDEIISPNNLPFAYCGDGSLIIGFKNPDFYATNGRKICIEVAYPYFKIRDYGSRENYERKRPHYYGKYGWKCLVFWGNGLNEFELSEDKIVEKIREVLG